MSSILFKLADQIYAIYAVDHFTNGPLNPSNLIILIACNIARI